jgi:hypothetical protein
MLSQTTDKINQADMKNIFDSFEGMKNIFELLENIKRRLEETAYITAHDEIESIFSSLDKIKTQYSESKKQAGEINRLKGELRSIIDSLSTYGDQGVSAILDLFEDSDDPNTTPTDVRTYGYRKITEIKKARRR